MGTSKGVVGRAQACDGHCGCFFDTLRVEKLKKWLGLKRSRILDGRRWRRVYTRTGAWKLRVL